MKHLILPLVMAMMGAPVLASECPTPPDHSESLNMLIAQVQNAPDEHSARLIFNDMWSYWADAPDEIAQGILDQGMQKRAAWDLLGAREDFDTLVAYCPHYAEGFNQRAFVNFLRQDYVAALPDLERAIDLSPRHIGALSGRAMALIGLGRDAEAQDALAEVLELNPWLPERGLLKAPPSMQNPGEEL
ncbi:Tetratricopeptide repeat-containing protein [Shimia gijangensis]|uniref:Tetratricopeptide repeat-containing protein n=1 Tax=Shimia gijangensis TaxID=1470563 RepID=A0A1M6IWA1_9RHOB|nr:tetratricopeptide repeat protein [Shimia gijangensis]SHJ38746.1 Tetratricopeptide repeat-containing protein [Shimia gijangensis]